MFMMLLLFIIDLKRNWSHMIVFTLWGAFLSWQQQGKSNRSSTGSTFATGWVKMLWSMFSISPAAVHGRNGYLGAPLSPSSWTNPIIQSKLFPLWPHLKLVGFSSPQNNLQLLFKPNPMALTHVFSPPVVCTNASDAPGSTTTCQWRSVVDWKAMIRGITLSYS